MRRLLCLSFIFWGCGGDPISSLPPCPDCTALVGGKIFDGTTTKPALVLLSGNTIQAVVEEEVPPDVGTIVDLSGQTLLPGFFDLHVHVYTPPTEDGFTPPANLARLQLQAFLRNGVTGIGDLGSPSEGIFPDRAESQRNLIFPRIWAAGPMLTAEGGHPCGQEALPVCQPVRGIADAEQAVQAIEAEQPDFYKLIIEPGWRSPLPTVDADTVMAIYSAATTRNRPLWAHVTRASDLDLALDVGVRRLAHLPFRDLLSEAQALRLAQTNTVVVPTIGYLDALDRLGRGELTELDDPLVAKDVHPRVRADLQDPARIARYLDPVTKTAVAEVLSNVRQNLSLLVLNKVSIVAGTDAGNVANFHGVSLRRELALYVEAGLTPAEALKSATAEPARLLGRPDLGNIVPTATADLVAVEGDPLLDLSALGRVTHVWKGGAEVDRASLAASP
ncbi:MAG: amidohydrolase family protein [Deltaproteobacteria bacterium]|nr:amidohydrolase family protein [Deltaproteobacteria bacterium]